MLGREGKAHPRLGGAGTNEIGDEWHCKEGTNVRAKADEVRERSLYPKGRRGIVKDLLVARGEYRKSETLHKVHARGLVLEQGMLGSITACGEEEQVQGP